LSHPCPGIGGGILGIVTDLSVSVSEHDGESGPCRVITLAGEADVSTSAMAEAFDAEVAKRPRLLVVDLSALSFIDSSALSVLMRSSRALDRDGGTLALVDPSPAVARILDLINIAHTIPVYASLREATAG
jgi:stage II sporulation protein AA (anti-sigma F factor antagonist)